MGGSPVVLTVVGKRVGWGASGASTDGRNAYTGVKPAASLTGGARGRSFAPCLALVAIYSQQRGGLPSSVRLRALLLRSARPIRGAGGEIDFSPIRIELRFIRNRCSETAKQQAAAGSRVELISKLTKWQNCGILVVVVMVDIVINRREMDYGNSQG
jgi:hypothetical protein